MNLKKKERKKKKFFSRSPRREKSLGGPPAESIYDEGDTGIGHTDKPKKTRLSTPHTRGRSYHKEGDSGKLGSSPDSDTGIGISSRTDNI